MSPDIFENLELLQSQESSSPESLYKEKRKGFFCGETASR